MDEEQEITDSMIADIVEICERTNENCVYQKKMPDSDGLSFKEKTIEETEQ